MAKEKKTKDDRKRNWATVVYPESAPQGWQEILSDYHIAAFISPLHDQDLNPTGEEKKPHYHVMLMFEGKKSYDQVHEMITQIGGVGLEVVDSLRGYARYLCHLDNPEKALYMVDDVKCISGADYTGIIGLALDKYKAIREMMLFCRDSRIYSYAQLLDYAGEERMDWFRVLCDSGTYVLKEYLKSLNWEFDDKKHLEKEL